MPRKHGVSTGARARVEAAYPRVLRDGGRIYHGHHVDAGTGQRLHGWYARWVSGRVDTLGATSREAVENATGKHASLAGKHLAGERRNPAKGKRSRIPLRISVGDRVHGNQGTADDEDVGTVHEVQDNLVRVGWDSGVQTWETASRLIKVRKTNPLRRA